MASKWLVIDDFHLDYLIKVVSASFFPVKLLFFLFYNLFIRSHYHRPASLKKYCIKLYLLEEEVLGICGHILKLAEKLVNVGEEALSPCQYPLSP